MTEQTPLSHRNKRPNSFTRRTALGGAVAGFALEAFAQEKSTAESRTATKPAAALPNLHPPVVETKCGKLRGFRDGKTSTVLGVPYAVAERFEMPKPVPAWEGIKGAQVWGPVGPIPQAARSVVTTSSSRTASGWRTNTARC